MLCLSEGFGSLTRRNSAKFEKKFLKIFKIERVSQVKVLPSSIALKLEMRMRNFLNLFIYF